MQKTEIDFIKNTKHNPDKFIQRGRGYVDWSFLEVCEYLGYAGALDYVGSMHRWYNYETKYAGKCLLDISHKNFIQHAQSIYLSTDSGGSDELHIHKESPLEVPE